MIPNLLGTGSRLRQLGTWAFSFGEGRVIQRTESPEGRAKIRRESFPVAGLTTHERLDFRIVMDQ